MQAQLNPIRAMTVVAPETERTMEQVRSSAPNSAVENVQSKGNESQEIGIGKNRFRRPKNPYSIAGGVVPYT